MPEDRSPVPNGDNAPDREDPEVFVNSASQASTWAECKRKWAWRYIAGIRPPPHPSADLGTRVHAHLERYMRDGTPIAFIDEHGRRDESAEIAAAGVHLLPPPGSGVVERAFNILLPLGPFDGPARRIREVWVTGRKDLELPGHVYDHKTTSSISKWAKSTEELLADVQSGVYAWESLRETDRKSVDLHWIYYQTRGTRRAEPREVTMPREQARAVFDHFLVMSKDIATTLVNVSKDDILSLPPEPRACEGFGGCPYRDKCNLSPMQRLVSISKKGTKPAMSLLDQLRKDTNTETSDPIAKPEEKAPLPPPVAPSPTESSVEPPAINPPESKEPGPTPEEVKATTPAPEPAAPKAKRTRAKKAEGEVAPAVMSSDIEKPKPALFIDCYPQGVNATFIDRLIDEAKKIVNAKAEVGDYRYVDFGKGAGMVCEAFFALFDAALASEDAPEAWIVYTSISEVSFLLSGLVARSGMIVRAR